MNRLLKKRTVLSLLQSSDTPVGNVYFTAPVEEATAPVALHMHEEVFEELGSPEQVTITVEPGDRLNT